MDAVTVAQRDSENSLHDVGSGSWRMVTEGTLQACAASGACLTFVGQLHLYKPPWLARVSTSLQNAMHAALPNKTCDTLLMWS